MEIINIPIVDFYKKCLDCAEATGFSWVLCLLAREADAEETYDQIKRYWSSLHDLTGTEILFVFAGALREKNDFSTVLHHESESWRGLRNGTMHIVNEPAPTIPFYNYPMMEFKEESFGMIKTNHTRSISEIKDYFGLSEKMIPSLIFTPTNRFVRDEHVVVPLKGENVYQEIKKIIENLESPLKDLKREQFQYQQIESQLKDNSKKMEKLCHANKAARRYANAKRQLITIIDNTDDSKLKNDLVASMRNRCVADWHAFNHQTRAYLNQYLDLSANNPDIESECGDIISELERLVPDNIEKERIANEMRKEITSQFEKLGQIIRGLPNKATTVEKGVDIVEKRFKIAFSFPGEFRSIVSEIAQGLAGVYSEERILYDYFHSAELARPNLDTYLQNLYRNESELIVVFICADYSNKKWCGIEWRAIRDLLNSKEADDRILFIKCGDGEIDGVFGTVDGYIDATQFSVPDIVTDIQKRYAMLSNRKN